MSDEGLNQFMDYLKKLNGLSNCFKSIVTASEIMSELPLTDEQIELANVVLEKMQYEWSKAFIKMLEMGIENLKRNMELKE